MSTFYRVLRASDTETAQDGEGWTFDAASGTQVPTDVITGGGSSNLTVVSGTATLDDGVDVGTLVGYRATASTTFTGQGGSVVLAAGVHIFERVTGGWTYRTIDEGTGLTPPAPDTTAPTPGTLAVTGSGDAGSTRTLTVTGASDETALHATPYRFSTDGGTTWSAYQSSNAFTTAALSAGTYQPRVMVRDAAGNTATASAADFTVAAAPSGPTYAETFTYADTTLIKGLSTEIGASPMYVDSAIWLTATTRSGSNASLAITGGRVPVAGASANGVAIEAASASTYRDSRNQVAYDVSAASNAAVLVSTADREAVASANGDPIIIKGDGNIARWTAPTTYIATGQPTTGTIEVERVGTAVNVKVNGTQVATYTATDNMTPLRFGVAAQRGGVFDDWKVWA